MPMFHVKLIRLLSCHVNQSGYKFPKDWKVIVWIRSIHVDPDYYDDPLTFNPDRWSVSTKILTLFHFFALFNYNINLLNIIKGCCSNLDLLLSKISTGLDMYLGPAKYVQLTTLYGSRSLQGFHGWRIITITG